jgi:hypothetical protein
MSGGSRPYLTDISGQPRTSPLPARARSPPKHAASVEARTPARGYPDDAEQGRAEGVAMTLIDEHIEVTCLECGLSRTVTGLTDTALGICATCGYIGWALAKDVNFAQLKTLRRLELAFA